MATRSKRFLAGLITGYGSIAANLVFTLVSIPLALFYLDKEQFGLWALALQINGYLALIDLGMSGAVSRFVADDKDDVNGGAYGSNILTGGLVFLIQGFLIALVGMALSWFAPQAFGIPDHLSSDFRNILLILCCTTGASVALRSISSPLWAFQRNDVINGCAAAGLILNLLLLWLGFRAGWGILTLALAPIPGTFLTLAFYAFVCLKNGYYPTRDNWGAPSLKIFKQVFSYGKDVMLISLGNQLINATQIMITSRFIGLDAAATLSIGLKFYTMAMLFVQNPIAASSAGLTELHVRGERETFTRRYFDILAIILVLATVAACCLVVGNRSAISLWTGGKIHWTWGGDLMLGLLIVCRNLNGYLITFFGLMKNWRPVRYLYLAEGLLFVPTAIWAADRFGLIGVLGASLASHLLVTMTFSLRAAHRGLGTLDELPKHAIMAIGIVGGAWLLAGAIDRAEMDMALAIPLDVLAAAVASLITWKLLLPTKLKGEAFSRILSITARLRGRTA